MPKQKKDNCSKAWRQTASQSERNWPLHKQLYIFKSICSNSYWKILSSYLNSSFHWGRRPGIQIPVARETHYCDGSLHFSLVCSNVCWAPRNCQTPAENQQAQLAALKITQWTVLFPLLFLESRARYHFKSNWCGIFFVGAGCSLHTTLQ